MAKDRASTWKFDLVLAPLAAPAALPPASRDEEPVPSFEHRGWFKLQGS
ncbi:hypothetical protein [Mesorhizobium shangrilense]|uniref:Uncharacterized protein n=1 Tax=Mesorhizobium shangrilense TaxID=460060 RepID=A0ABV2DIQ1_9HYPH